MLLKGKRIFMVEDNAGNLAVATLYLERYGATIKFVRWGDDAVEVLRRNMPIDAILMDLMLPGRISGFDVFQQIRECPDLAHIPVVAVSASDPDIAMPRAARLGFSGYISKPVSGSIAQHIATVVGGKKVWAGDFNDFAPV
jgi:CheY-like chemotaxis protein